MKKVAVSIALVIFISGCGGSGSSSDTLGSSVQTPDINITAISGVYDSHRNKGEWIFGGQTQMGFQDL